MRNRKYLLNLIIVFFIVGCSSDQDVIKKAVNELDFKVLLPNYVPEELKPERPYFEDEIFILTYKNRGGSKYIEIIQDNCINGLNTHIVRDFVQTEEDPYKNLPNMSYVIIGEYVGVFSINDKLDNLNFVFIPLSLSSENHYPFYMINSVGVDVEEFHEVIKSLK